MRIKPWHVATVACVMISSVVVPVGPAAFATEIAPPVTVAETVDVLTGEVVDDYGDGDVADDADESEPTDSLDGVPTEAAGELDGPADDQDGVQAGDPPVIDTDIEFSMIGFRLPAGSMLEDIVVRTRSIDGQWSDWEILDVDDPEVDGPDPESVEGQQALPGTDPLWVGAADAFQVSAGPGLEDVEAVLIDTDGLNETVAARIARQLSPRQIIPEAQASDDRPAITTRAQWGADESIRRSSGRAASNVTFAIAHHTAGTNSYTSAQSPAIVRGIYEYHVRGRGWSDIGYNILIDRYGQVFEGTFGGLDRGVIGAHAANFNTGSFGIGVLGNFDVAPLPAAAESAFNQVVAWKYAVHGIDASPDRRITVNGLRINVLAGHRDVGSTACPGRFFVQRLSSMRAEIAPMADRFARAMSPQPVPAGALPIPGDWEGNGVQQPGWFFDGRFYLPIGPGGETRSFQFGRPGDTPLAGDWNGSGRDGIGVHRGNRFYLRNALSSGASDHYFTYGRAGDQPIAGDWNRSGADSIGVFRDGSWFVRNELSSGPSWRHFRYGRPGDTAYTGDWEGLGRDGVGVRRGSTWYVRSHLKNGPSYEWFDYGRPTDLPVTGDWNSSGESTTVGIVRDNSWRISNHLPAQAPDYSLLYSPLDIAPH